MTATIRHLYQLLKLATVLGLLATLSLAGYFLLYSPVAFQKSVSLRFVALPVAPAADGSQPLDIASLIRGIPYQSPGGMVYEVHPRKKYEQTIGRGYGNCSNLVFGCAYELSRRGHDYQIVHLIPHDGFLQGNGHTVLNTYYQTEAVRCWGIVDLLEGGIPTTADRPIQLDDLRQGQLRETAVVSLNPLHDAETPYYEEFLNESVIGVIRRDDAESYFAFLEAIYVPLGHPKLEKIAYDGLAVVLGRYPPIYVEEAHYHTLFREHQLTRWLAFTLLYCLRGVPCLFAALLAGALFLRVQQRREAKAETRASAQQMRPPTERLAA